MSNTNDIYKAAWQAADELRANSGLMSGQYCLMFLGLLFLRLAAPQGYERALSAAECAGRAVDEAMKALEERLPQLSGKLPAGYADMDSTLLKNIDTILAGIRLKTGSDSIGRLYEYFLDQFSALQAKEDGAFYTPDAVVWLMAQVLSPKEGTAFDPACGTGGMFVGLNSPKLNCLGQDKNENTLRIASMNAALHGLRVTFAQGNSYYEDPLNLSGRCDTIMSNPPFNVYGVDAARAERAGRLPFGLPDLDKDGKVRNANYLWAQYFYSYLNVSGRGAFIMPCSALQSRGRDEEIRRKIIETGCVEAIVAIGERFFHNSTVPCSLWFIDKGRAPGSPTLFIDATGLYRDMGRTLRTWDCAQASLIASAILLFRGETARYDDISSSLRDDIVKVFSRTCSKCSRLNLYFKYADGDRWEKTVADVQCIDCAKADLCLLKAKLHLLTEETVRQMAALPMRLNSLIAAEKRAAFADICSAAGHKRLNNKQVLAAASREADSLVEEARYCSDLLDTALRTEQYFSGGSYADVPGLCRRAESDEIEAANWNLNVTIYTGRNDPPAASNEGAESSVREAAAELVRLSDEYSIIMARLEAKLGGLTK